MNKQISNLILDKLVWDNVLAILLNPMALEEGYEQSVEQQKLSKSKKIAQVETLERGLIKIKQKRQNLSDAYLDPDIEMPKVEYLNQKARLDEEAHTIEGDLGRLQRELAVLPQPADLEILRQFATEIASGLLPIEELTIERKRETLELMHIKVIYRPDGQFALDGWFSIQEMEEGLLGRSSSCREGHW